MGSISNPPQVPVYITFGTYTGDTANDRQIPHSLGRLPKLVLVSKQADPLLGMQAIDRMHSVSKDTVDSGLTAMDTVNFSVDDRNTGFNSSAKVYNWVAIG